jgi:hypothetical protein
MQKRSWLKIPLNLGGEESCLWQNKELYIAADINSAEFWFFKAIDAKIELILFFLTNNLRYTTDNGLLK